MGTETFELERFVWATPDRLEIDGRFVGLGDTPPGDPVLVLRGEDQTHRLPAVSNGAAMDDQGQWHAAFAWQEAPTAFGAVQLEPRDEPLPALPARPGRRRTEARQCSRRLLAGAGGVLTPEELDPLCHLIEPRPGGADAQRLQKETQV